MGVRTITKIRNNQFLKPDSESYEQELERKMALILASLDEDKAENIVTLDIARRSSFAERMIIASGLSPRQIASIAAHLERRLKESGFRWVQLEGEGSSDWVLMDAGDVIVHLFMPETRDLYALERMWGNDFDHSEQEHLIGESL